MKKRILIIASCLSVCAVAALGINLSAKANMSSLITANIDALTEWEWNTGVRHGYRDATDYYITGYYNDMPASSYPDKGECCEEVDGINSCFANYECL